MSGFLIGEASGSNYATHTDDKLIEGLLGLVMLIGGTIAWHVCQPVSKGE